MRPIDEDTITQAVIARHADGPDARLRELTTCLVQHLHAFARETRLTPAEWRAGLRFLVAAATPRGGRPHELALLSDTLGLSTLVAALQPRAPAGCTEAAACADLRLADVPGPASPDEPAPAEELCCFHGWVRSADGQPVAGATVKVWRSAADGMHAVPPPQAAGQAARRAFVSGPDGSIRFGCLVAAPLAIDVDGAVGGMLRALGRSAWRPAHLHFEIEAPGCERFVTQVFRRGDPHLDSDAAFGVRPALVADWTRHPPGRTPDGHASAVPFTALDFTFVLNNVRTGDRPT